MHVNCFSNDPDQLIPFLPKKGEKKFNFHHIHSVTLTFQNIPDYSAAFEEDFRPLLYYFDNEKR